MSRQLTALIARSPHFAPWGEEGIRALVASLLAGGQWLALRDAGQLAGWVAWWRVDEDSLDLLRDFDLPDLIEHRAPLTIRNGPHVFVVMSAVATDAPRDTYRKLARGMEAVNQDAATIATWFSKMDGRRFWRRRPIRRVEA